MQQATTLLYVTGNRFKFQVAKRALRGINIVLEQKRIDLPEIQSNSVQEIAEFSAKWATEKIYQPFIVTDAGFYIDALNGFPGPLIKFINQWFSVEDLLRLMQNHRYRRVTVHDCLVYSNTGQPLLSFLGTYHGEIATQPGLSTGTPIERLFIPQGYDKPISEFSPAEQESYWSETPIWHDFRNFLKS